MYPEICAVSVFTFKVMLVLLMMMMIVVYFEHIKNRINIKIQQQMTKKKLSMFKKGWEEVQNDLIPPLLPN